MDGLSNHSITVVQGFFFFFNFFFFLAQREGRRQRYAPSTVNHCVLVLYVLVSGSLRESYSLLPGLVPPYIVVVSLFYSGAKRVRSRLTTE